MSWLNKEIIWTCPNCNNINSDTLFDIESQPVTCDKCFEISEVYLKLNIEIDEVKGISS